MLLLFFNLLYLQSSLGEGLSGSTFAGLSAEQLEVQELTRAALLAFVSTGNKGGTCGQVDNGPAQPGSSLRRLKLDIASTKSCPTGTLELHLHPAFGSEGLKEFSVCLFP